MKQMSSAEIRAAFLRFFESKGHTVVPSSSLVPNDPTLLLTTAGMVQFKPIFLGEVSAPYPRAVSVQKCLRTTDIGQVGGTARHLTFFEMLGNFSFGDYYKDEAIVWAWELLTEVLALPAERLWVTVYTDDDEAAEIWRDRVGVAQDRIVRLGEADNFWAAGPTGPCGPCSEIMWDQGEENGCGKETCGVDCDCGRYLEVWNLVFMQYDRDEAQALHPLERRGIDTGMGLERLATVLQAVPTNFETDLLGPIIGKAEEISGTRRGSDHTTDVSLHILGDHLRALTFLIGDGVLPSNEGRGYVLRRLLRRAVRHGRLLGIEEPFLLRLMDVVIDLMGDAYPDLRENRTYIERVASTEEERFTQTLRQGSTILQSAIEDVRATNDGQLPGEVVFRLYDTYGFPMELTTEIAEEHGLGVDEQGFEALMAEQKAKARDAAAFESGFGVERAGTGAIPATIFEGYEQLEVEAQALGVLSAEDQQPIEEAGEGKSVQVVLDRSPFYAEAGGQVGDSGAIVWPTGEVAVQTTTATEAGVYLHHGKVVSGSIAAGRTVTARVAPDLRVRTMRNHTATHLLHWALRTRLGEHVKQGGSLVAPDRLRFDYTHYSALTQEEIQDLERMVNERIVANAPVATQVSPFEEARKAGAIALFGEKYGTEVRVVEAGDYSKELCGGTHVGRTGDIGLMRIISEGSIGANLRRIEAVTGMDALAYTQGRDTTLLESAEVVGSTPDNLVERLRLLVDSQRRLDQRMEAVERKLRGRDVEELLTKAVDLDSTWALVAEVTAEDFDALRSYVDLVRDRRGGGVLLFGSRSEDRALLVASVDKDLIARGFDAGKLVREAAAEIGGGGGGRPDMAQAGGKKPEQLSKALEAGLKHIQALAESARVGSEA